MAAITQNITAEQGAALSVTFTGAVSSLTGRTLRMHVREKAASTSTKLVASTSDSRLAVASASSATLTVGADVMAALSISDATEYWVYDLESYTSATDVRREWQGRFTVTRDVTRDTEADGDTALSGAVLYSGPQSLTAAQQLQARENIDFAEAARDVIGAALVAGSNMTVTVSDGGDTITLASTGGGGVSDGDKGDITVSASGATWTVDANAVTFAKMQAVSANVLLGNDATGTAVEEIACTAAGRALLDDATVADQRTTLGLGTAAVAATGDFEAAGAVSTHNAVTTAHGISAFGATLVDDATASDARTTLGLGTAATTAATAYATAAQGALADTALQSSAIGSTVQAYDADLTTWAGITPGANVGTALAVAVGSAGAVVVNGGALGTPSSGTLTNCTGLPSSGMPTLTYISPDSSNAHTFDSTDAGKCIRFTHASASTITFPDTLTAGLGGWIMRAAGAGAITWGVTGSMVVTPSAASTGHTGTAAAPAFLWWECDATNSVIIGGDTA